MKPVTASHPRGTDEIDEIQRLLGRTRRHQADQHDIGEHDPREIDRYREFGFPVVLDAEDGLETFPGPLAGILAGLRETPTPWTVVVPCDAPFLPANLVAHLADALAGSRAAVVYVGDTIERRSRHAPTVGHPD